MSAAGTEKRRDAHQKSDREVHQVSCHRPFSGGSLPFFQRPPRHAAENCLHQGNGEDDLGKDRTDHAAGCLRQGAELEQRAEHDRDREKKDHSLTTEAPVYEASERGHNWLFRPEAE